MVLHCYSLIVKKCMPDKFDDDNDDDDDDDDGDDDDDLVF